MSDITSLSSDYSATATFAQEFNSAVLVLKRWHLGQSASSESSDSEVVNARRQLADHLRGILSRLSPDTEGGVTQPTEHIPEAVISRLDEKYRNNLVYFVSDLRQAIHSLKDAIPIEQCDFDTLDKVCDAADTVASASFRRLWRR